MKDYYSILQVDPRAEQEVIEAAYRRLMRKYHPDVLSSEERDSEEILRKVQELNAAYEVLGDSQRRQEYDRLRSVSHQRTSSPEPAAESTPIQQRVELENRTYLVRCTTTRRTFKMLLGRRKGWSGPFVVMGFEPVDSQSIESEKGNAPGLWSKFLAALSGKRNTTRSLASDMLPTPEETIQNLLDGANTLNMGDIEWAGHKCPDCAGEIVNPNGTIGTWSRCGTCHRLKCAGNSKKRLDGYYSTCPWCGATNETTRSVATGSKEQAILRGKYHETGKQDLPNLANPKQRPLDSKKK